MKKLCLLYLPTYVPFSVSSVDLSPFGFIFLHPEELPLITNNTGLLEIKSSTLFYQKCLYFTFIWRKFSPSTLKISFHYLLASIISDEKLWVSLTVLLLYVSFSLVTLRIFIMIQQFYNMLLSVSVYIAWSPLSFLELWVYIFKKFGKYSYFLKIFFSCVNLSSTSGSLITNLLNCFILPHKSLKDLFIVHFLVSVFFIPGCFGLPGFHLSVFKFTNIFSYSI